MRKPTKTLLTAVALLLAVTMLVSGCATVSTQPAASAPTTTVTPQGSPAASATPTEQAATLAPVNVIITAAGPPQKDTALVMDALSKYLKDKINASVTLNMIDFSNWVEQSNLILASGDPCDLMFTAAWSDYASNQAKGAFLDLTQLLQQYGQGILSSKYSWMIDMNKTNGKLYAIPSYQMLAEARGFIMRKDLFDKYGPSVNFQKKDVYTLQDIEPLLKAVKDNEPNITPYYTTSPKYLTWLSPWDRATLDDPTGVDCSNPTPKYVNFFDTDFYRQTIAITRQWYSAGYCNKDAATATQMPEAMMKSGKIFCYSMQTQYTTEYTISQQVGFPVVVCNIIPAYIHTIQGAMFVIPRQSQNPERAMMLLNLMHTDANVQNLLVYGIEGVHYVKKGGNTISVAPGIDPANDPYMNQYWEFGNQSLLYDLDTGTPNGAQALDNFNSTAVKSPTLGFVYDPSKMTNQLGALANVVAQYDPSLASGSVDANQNGMYDKFIAALKAAGIDDVLADENAQLDAWMKANGR